MKWKPLPLERVLDDQEAYKDFTRANALGSLFFFASHVLHKNRLSGSRPFLHQRMCTSLEREDLHLVLEQPMGHFKTTVGTEALSMWWALPFTARDEFIMRNRPDWHCPDEWIAWMKAAHNPNTRTLITHEIESRAIAMGKAVDEHYQSNDLFRFLFPEILPDSTCTWNDHTKFHKRDGPADATTGTFEYRGVGQALQGVHPDSTIQDDNMGKAAQSSMLNSDGRVLEDLIRWHRQLTTRIDTSDASTVAGRQLVIGNRWGHNDLNSWIKKNQPQFKFETHSAEGGCCPIHPAGQAIFPEEWTMQRLAQTRQDVGPYDYAHFYLNQSVLPEECIFKADWIRRYNYKQSRPDLPIDDLANMLLIHHQAKNGEVIEDFEPYGVLHVTAIVDLAHAKKRSRCKHVIAVIGFDPEKDWFYLLDLWAKPAPYSELTDMLYKMCRRWRIRDPWLEQVAAQNLLAFHIGQRNQFGSDSWKIFPQELPYDNSENAKKNRIESMEPVYKNGQFWAHPSQQDFFSEYESYPASATIDVLDTIGFCILPEVFGRIRSRQAMEFVTRQQDEFAARNVSAGGY